MMKSIPFFFALILLMAVVSCKKENTSTKQITTDTAMLNMAYGADSKQTIDAYLPANRSTDSTNVIVLIHGGSWVSGDKADLTAYVSMLKARLPKYAIFNINYRLSNNSVNKFPVQETDVAAAISAIYNNAANTYLISKKYVLIGVSAGAHLAMLQGFKNNAVVMPKAVASFSGPSDLTDMYNNPVGGNQSISQGVAYAVGATPSTNPLLYASSSPVNFITTTSPPTIVFQGGADPLVSVNQATAVQTKLANAGVINQYVLYQNQAHIDSWDNLTLYDAFNKLQAFIAINVK